MTGDITREAQYQRCIELRDSKGLTRLGLMSNQDWHDDPKHFLFSLARYKFVAKMLAGHQSVLEVGCGDGFGTRVVLQAVDSITAVDFDPVLVEDAIACMDEDWQFDCRVHDMLEGPIASEFDGAFTLDVLEHIPEADEQRFVLNIVNSLTQHGVLVVGTPSIHSQVYASTLSKQGHVNCKDDKGLRELLSHFFQHVFIFSMNDEVVHTGFYPMAHYLLALCCTRKDGIHSRGG